MFLYALLSSGHIGGAEDSKVLYDGCDLRRQLWIVAGPHGYHLGRQEATCRAQYPPSTEVANVYFCDAAAVSDGEPYKYDAMDRVEWYDHIGYDHGEVAQ